MAERRMFSKTIIDSDLFMDLPLTAQALYFHLAMRADDDGFIGNSKKLCRMLGVGEEDLALLIEKELLIKFDSGVVAVKHWKVNNLIKNDRYKATIYQEEKSFLEVENNTYKKCEKKPRRAPQKDEKASLEPKWNPSGTHLEPQVRLGKDSIGKVSIGKVSLDKEIECADGTDEPCGSLVSPEGDIAADAASSADAEQSNKVDFSFSSASAEQPTQNSYSAPSASPNMDKGDISANMPRVDKGDTYINDEAREADSSPMVDKPDISAAAPRVNRGDASVAAAPRVNRGDASVAAPRTYNGNKPSTATSGNKPYASSGAAPSGNKPYASSNAAPRAYNPDTFFEMPKADEDAPRFDNLVPEEYTKDPQWENYLTDARESLRQIFGAPKPPKKTDTKPRYGNFDPEEAMAIAIARTEYEFDKTDKNKSS